MQVIQDELIIGNESLSKTLKAGCEKQTLFVHCNLIDIDVFGLIWALNAKFLSCTLEKSTIQFDGSTVFIDSTVRQSKLSGGDLEAINTLFEDSSFSFSNEYTTDCTYSRCEGQNVSMACPTHGAFIGWKKCIATLGRTVNTWIRKPVIVKLQIPARAQRISTNERKCRCSEAKVLDIQNLDGTKAEVPHAYSSYAGCGFRYEVGKIVYADKFDTDPLNTCSHGINFFITRQEAVDFSVAI